jgi:antitoxin component of MazEF toxin-antitoxin module
MPNRSQKERAVRQLQKSNGTYYVTLPKEVVGELGWQERQKVTVRKYGKKLIIEDWS